MFASKLFLPSIVCLGTAMGTAFATPYISRMPGDVVTPEQAARVFGAHSGTTTVSALVASSTVGCSVNHPSLELSTTTTYCAGSTYTGCGGGACGTRVVNNLGSIGNRGFTVSNSCSSKPCGMTTVTCGSITTSGCI